jgi:uncharacterized membrane protein YbhN (UPF0104 family)
VVPHALDELSAFRMRPREWVEPVGLSFVNWLASVGCLVASILAVGASVPWTKVIPNLLRRRHGHQFQT